MTRRDLRSTRLIVAKGLLFVCLGVVSAILVLIYDGVWWKRCLLLAVCIWAFCRAYYFALYVLQHYVDPGFRYSGLISAIRHLLNRATPVNPSDHEDHGGRQRNDPSRSGRG